MTAVAEPDAWMETCFVTITESGNPNRNEFAAITETVDIDQGEKNATGVALVNGGRIFKIDPQTDTTVTLEVYPLSLGARDQSSVAEPGLQQLYDYGTQDTTEPLASTATRLRANVQLAIMWTTDTTATTASGATAANERGLRFQMVNAQILSYKPSFTDGTLKYNVTIRAPAFNKAGTANTKWDSTDGGAVIAAFSETYAGVLQ